MIKHEFADVVLCINVLGVIGIFLIILGGYFC
jgi:hypothetical protein